MEEGEGIKVFNESHDFSTGGEIDFIDLISKIEEVVRKSGIKNGLIRVFAPHATGILVLTEHEPILDNDIRNLLEKLIPKRASYQHPSNVHSLLRSMILCSDKTLPVIDEHAFQGHGSRWFSLR